MAIMLIIVMSALLHLSLTSNIHNQTCEQFMGCLLCNDSECLQCDSEKHFQPQPSNSSLCLCQDNYYLVSLNR